MLVVVNIGCITAYCINHHKKMNAHQAFIERLANIGSVNNIWPKADYLKLQSIEDQYRTNGGVLSDGDFKWLMNLYTMNPLPKGYDRAIAEPDIMACFMDGKALTSQQKEQIYVATLPYFSQEDDNDNLGALKIHACNVMRVFKEKRAIPQVLTLINDPRPIVRQRSREALRAMKYRLPATASP